MIQPSALCFSCPQRLSSTPARSFFKQYSESRKSMRFLNHIWYSWTTFHQASLESHSTKFARVSRLRSPRTWKRSIMNSKEIECKLNDCTNNTFGLRVVSASSFIPLFHLTNHLVHRSRTRMPSKPEFSPLWRLLSSAPLTFGPAVECVFPWAKFLESFPGRCHRHYNVICVRLLRVALGT